MKLKILKLKRIQHIEAPVYTEAGFFVWPRYARLYSIWKIPCAAHHL